MKYIIDEGNMVKMFVSSRYKVAVKRAANKYTYICVCVC